MRLGKLANDRLKFLILDKFKHFRSEVVCSPQVGVDCAAVDLGGRLAIMSTDPITSTGNNLGRLTVHVSCNDAAAAGAEPIGLLVTLLLPPSATEDLIAKIADDLSAAAIEANVEIIGGHTEVTDSVTHPVTCATVLAKAAKRGILKPGGMTAGNDIVLTKHACIEGTVVIATDFADKLNSLTRAELDEAVGYIEQISVVKEGLYAIEHGATAMHDVTEGGILGAAYEMAFSANCGMTLHRDAIPITDVTLKITQTLCIDPYKLLSSGSMLIACENGAELIAGLAGIGIEATVIGKAEKTDSNVVYFDGELVEPPQADELYKLYKKALQ